MVLTDLLSLNLGAFGEVRMCVHRESGAQRAVKVLRKSHMDEDEKRMLFNEINILKEIVSHCSTQPTRRGLFLGASARGSDKSHCSSLLQLRQRSEIQNQLHGD